MALSSTTYNSALLEGNVNWYNTNPFDNPLHPYDRNLQVTLNSKAESQLKDDPEPTEEDCYVCLYNNKCWDPEAC